MRVEYVQRWRDRAGQYHPAGAPINTRDYEIARIGTDTEARTFVAEHHYEGSSYPAARRRFGLYTKAGELVGVAVFSTPINPRSLDCVPGEERACAELGRFVLVDSVPTNGESYFLARCFESLRSEGFTGIISFSDPEIRRDDNGRITFRGHVGTVYQATNATFLGRTKRDTRIVWRDDGTTLHRRSLAKLRALDRGWAHVAKTFESHGADPFTGDAQAYVRRWLPLLTSKACHPGKLKYAWALRRRDRRFLPPSLPYPKMIMPPQLHLGIEAPPPLELGRS